ncbi:hypothetical protein ONO86_05660 [Micromonospora noduli]|nr:hypothetical protein ONO86_05660 [Micromonospora noduli]
MVTTVSERELKLLARAAQLHNDNGCRCDPRYLRSCPRFAAAILEAGKEEAVGGRSCNVASTPRDEPSTRGTSRRPRP